MAMVEIEIATTKITVTVLNQLIHLLYGDSAALQSKNTTPVNGHYRTLYSVTGDSWKTARELAQIMLRVRARQTGQVVALIYVNELGRFPVLTSQ
jgi:hypothetical protein